MGFSDASISLTDREAKRLLQFDRLWPDADLRAAWRVAHSRLVEAGAGARSFACVDVADIDNRADLRRASSLSGMALHLEHRQRGKIVNKRRPNVAYSTYPTAPWVGAVCADYIVRRALTRENVSPRIADPTMESGQLLIEVALAAATRMRRQRDDQAFARWVRTCLHGVDQNSDALAAVRALFLALTRVEGTPRLSPALHHGCAMSWLEDRRTPLDGLINNPPWGVRSDPFDAAALRACSASDHHLNPYIGFVELGLRRLKGQAPFAFILPSQILTARNARRLRDWILESTMLDALVLAPRRVFADAAVRSVVLLGRVRTSAEQLRRTFVVAYPAEHSLRVRSQARATSMDCQDWRGSISWGGAFVEPFDAPGADCSNLAEVARVCSGLKAYRNGAGAPPQKRETVAMRPFTHSAPGKGRTPTLRGRDVGEFSVSAPEEFLEVGPWLAEPGVHISIFNAPRVLVRELYRRDGKLTASVAPRGVIGYHGLLTVSPAGNLDVFALSALLNSDWAAAWVRAHSASYFKVCYHRISVGELRRFPVPKALVRPRSKAEKSIALRLSEAARRAHKCGGASESIRTEIERLVRRAYEGQRRKGPAC